MAAAAMAEDNVKGGKEIMLLAEKGLALFAKMEDDTVDLDVDGATAFKAETDAKFAAMEAEAAALTGKDNKKARTEKSKEAAALKTTPEYIDACKVVKGQPPVKGHFAKITKAAVKEEVAAEAAPAAAAAGKEKAVKAPKAGDSAGISKAERDELEKIKVDLISRKKELKEQGMSGGQMNKDEQVVAWVKRMNDLKEKENPGCLTAAKEDKKASKGKKMSSEQVAEKIKLEEEIAEYLGKLKGEFGYTAKEIKADPDMVEMTKKLAAFK